MQEKLVERWLTDANELTYQIPFCEVLVSRGHDVIHVSTHGRGEHGKDIVSRSRRGRLCTYQLKGGDISLSEWRRIRDEVAELVELPVRVPGVSESEPHTPYLVTNGDIRGDAVENIVRYRDRWHGSGAGRLRVISRRRLLRLFIDAHARFLPTGLVEFRKFVELFVADFGDRLPREKFARLLEEIVPSAGAALSSVKARRVLAGLAVIAGYIAEQYERAENHISAAEAWTIAATTVLHVAERNTLAATTYEPILRLLGLALDRCLEGFLRELQQRNNLVQGTSAIADPFVYGARVCLCFGWLAGAVHRGRLLSHPGLGTAVWQRRLLKREFPGIRFAGEVDWPTILLFSLYLERLDNRSSGEALLELWVRMILTQNRKGADGVPSPYWLHERVIAMANELLAPNEIEDFRQHTYSLPSALDMLVRRLRRRLVAQLWPASSRLQWCDFTPDARADYFRWDSPEGAVRTGTPVSTASWAEWRRDSGLVEASSVPVMLRRHPEWLAPFLLTYPHRANRTLSAFADAVLGGGARVVDK